MFRCALLLWCVGVCTGLQCASSGLKFSIISHRNSTGHWVAQVKLEHGGGQKHAGPWEVDVDHTTVKCDNSESVQIIATVTAPFPAPKGPPASGYDLVAGLGYYKMHTEARSWHEALNACEKEGAHLAVINSEEEAKALGPFWDMNPNILDGAQNNWAHVGFHDQYKEGEYLTIFNQTLVGAGYVKWYGGDPHGVGQNCGIVVRRANLLADIPCPHKLPFFCESEL